MLTLKSFGSPIPLQMIFGFVLLVVPAGCGEPPEEPDTRRVGILEPIMAIGGETPGFRLSPEGTEVDLSQVPGAEVHAGHQVVVTGRMETREGVERGAYEVLVADSVERVQ